MHVALIGATGLVGSVMLQVLDELEFPITQLTLVASERSVGKVLTYKGKSYSIVSMEDAVAAKPEIALFSAGSSTSKEWAPRFVAAGTTVIDNSSCWRMDPSVPLVVPEVNGHAIGGSKLIANPNCSTAQLVVVLKPLADRYGIKRLVISTYQSVTGTGKAAMDQLFGERSGEVRGQVYPHPIDLNLIPHCDIFLENDYTKEEMKLVHESRKILGLPGLAVTATCVRVPVIGGHSEAVNIEFEQPYHIDEVRALLAAAPGLVLQDDPSSATYPMPALAKDKNDVFVGRIRRDESCDNALNLWIVADNLRKGAATNAVQIAQYILAHQPVQA